MRSLGNGVSVRGGVPVASVVVALGLVVLATVGTLGVVGPDGAAPTAGMGTVDSSGDRLPDEWERQGVTPEGALLPESDPDRLTLHTQIVYGDGIEPLTDEEHEQLRAAFAEMPIENPDGSTGIDLRIDDDPPYGGELDEPIRLTETGDRDALAEAYYSPERMGPRHCVYHLVAVGEVDVPGYAGFANTPGRFSVVDGRYTDSYGGTVSYRVRAIVHELLHNVVGPVPSEARGGDRIHTESGWLTANSTNLSADEQLSSPVAEQLSENGFATAPDPRGENCRY